MKKILLIKSILLLTGLALAETTDGLNYSNGFCVSRQSELNKENAIVLVTETEINGRILFNNGPEHNFFKPESSTQELSTVDWGGALSLKKNYESNGVIEATFESHLHGESVGPMPVKCVIDIPVEKKPFEALGSASFHPWNSGDFCEEARAQADRSAKVKCTEQSAQRIYINYENVRGVLGKRA